MSSKLTIDVNLRNADKLKKLGDDATQAGNKLKNALQPNPGSAKAWNPYITAVKQLQAAQRAAASDAKRLEKETSDEKKRIAKEEVTAKKRALNDIRQAEKAAREADRRDARTAAEEEKKLAREVAASRKAAINDVRQARKAAQLEEQRIATMNRDAVNANLASKWNPQVTAKRNMDQATQNQALGPLATAIPVGGRLNTFNERLQAGQNAYQERFGAAAEAARSAGRTGLVVGGAGVAGGVSMAMTSSEISRVKTSFKRKLGEDAGEKFFAELEEFDRRSSVTNLRETIEQAQTALSQGLKPSEIIPLFDRLGDGIADAGKGAVEFNAAMRQIIQIRGKNYASGQDLNALAEGGGLGIAPMIRDTLGQERYAKVRSGAEPLTAEEFFKVFEKAMDAPEVKGANLAGNKELLGQISNLESAWFKLRGEMGSHLSPTVSTATQLLTKAADAFSAFPEPLQKVIALGGGAASVLTTLGGGALAAGAQLGDVVVGVKALKDAGGVASAVTKLRDSLEAFKFGIMTLPASFSTALAQMRLAASTPIAGASGGAIAGATVVGAAAGIATGFGLYKGGQALGLIDREQGFGDRMSTGWGRLRDLATGNSGHYDRQANLERAQLMYDKDTLAARKFAAEKKDSGAWTQEKADEYLAKRQLQIEKHYASEFKRNKYDQEYVAHSDRAKQLGAQLKFQSTAIPVGSPVANAAGDVLGGVSGGTGASTPGGAATVDNTDSQQREIDSLQDQIRQAKKDEKPALRERLVAAQRQMRDTKRALAAEKKLASKAEREAKARERAEKKALGIEIDYDQMESNVKETEASEAFNTKIAQLEAQRDAARDERNRALEKKLAFEIESLKAQRDLQVAMLNADSVALEDERKAEYLRRIARTKHKGAMERAAIDRDKKSGAERVLARLRAGGSIFGGSSQSGAVSSQTAAAVESVNSGTMFNPYSGGSQPGAGGTFTRMIGAAQAETESTSSSPRVLEFGQPRRSQAANGDWIFKIPELRVPDPLGGAAGAAA